MPLGPSNQHLALPSTEHSSDDAPVAHAALELSQITASLRDRRDEGQSLAAVSEDASVASHDDVEEPESPGDLNALLGGMDKGEFRSTEEPYAADGRRSSYLDNSLSSRVRHFLYPPNVPPSVQLFRRENIAIPACYFLVGALQGLSGALMNVYPIDLGATEAQQVTIGGLRGLPASFKLIYGFVSDSRPLFGYRRKSYMALGWLMTSASMLVLYYVVNSRGSPSVSFLSVSYFLFGFGFWYADVMADSVVAEKAKLEPKDTRGSLQSTCYSLRFFALMVFAPLSTYLYHKFGAKPIILLMGLMPLVILLPLVCKWCHLRSAEAAAFPLLNHPAPLPRPPSIFHRPRYVEGGVSAEGNVGSQPMP